MGEKKKCADIETAAAVSVSTVSVSIISCQNYEAEHVSFGLSCVREARYIMEISESESNAGMVSLQSTRAQKCFKSPREPVKQEMTGK